MSSLKSYASAPREDVESLSMLFENIDVLLRNVELIKSVPENYYIEIQGTGVTGVYIGSYTLYLGDLLQLWESPSLWIEKSGEAVKYIYHLGGFPTSGSCFLRMYNTKTSCLEKESRCHFLDYFRDTKLFLNNRPVRHSNKKLKVLLDEIKSVTNYHS